MCLFSGARTNFRARQERAGNAAKAEELSDSTIYCIALDDWLPRPNVAYGLTG